MTTDDLKKDADSSIETLLKEKETEFSEITGTPPGELAKQDPKALIAMWKEKFASLTIADLKDTKGYLAVQKAVALCRTTRTALDKTRKDQKKFFLDAGRAIDGYYNELIALVEPIEAELAAKKDAIDAEKERIKKEREEKEQARIDARIAQLTQAGCSFDGATYFIGTFSTNSLHIKNSTDADFAVTVKAAIDEAARLEEEKEEIVRQEQLRLRADRRHNALIDVGFVAAIGDDAYRRTNISKDVFGYETAVGVDFIKSCTDEEYQKIVDKAKADIQKRDEEREAQEKELKRKEQELAEKQKELEERERKEKERIVENRANQIRALGFVKTGEISFTLTLPHVEPYMCAVDHSWSDDKFEEQLTVINGIATKRKQESERLVKEAEAQKEKEIQERAEKLAAEKEQERIKAEQEKERLEGLRLEKEKKKAERQPDKAKLNTLAARLEATDFPEFKSEEAKKIKEEVISRLLDICAYIKDEADKL